MGCVVLCLILSAIISVLTGSYTFLIVFVAVLVVMLIYNLYQIGKISEYSNQLNLIRESTEKSIIEKYEFDH